jgi:hypothetical protein
MTLLTPVVVGVAARPRFRRGVPGSSFFARRRRRVTAFRR